MSRTITALFDSRADADMAKQNLKEADIDIGHITVADQSSEGFSKDSYSTNEDKGLWASIKGAFMPAEDRHTYEEGVRRGGFLLSGDVDEKDADRAVAILEKANTVDIDRRAEDWRGAGWKAPAAGSGMMGAGATDQDRKPMAANTGEQVIPIVEEKLTVGKREVSRGGVRVHSYVVEQPASEQVTLRDEHVSVERRPVDGAASTIGEDAFRERTIEMKETAEEAVVGKTARVVEEVVIGKDVGTRTETVTDTVRRTEVDIDRGDAMRAGGTTERTGMAGDRADTMPGDRSLGDKLADGAHRASDAVKDTARKL